MFVLCWIYLQNIQLLGCVEEQKEEEISKDEGGKKGLGIYCCANKRNESSHEVPFCLKAKGKEWQRK